MQLAKYLKTHQISRDDFARLIGVDRVTVWRWQNGKAFPIRHLAKIHAATKGRVTANDFADAKSEA